MKTIYRIMTVSDSGDSTVGFLVARSGLNDGDVMIHYRRLSGIKEKLVSVTREGNAYIA